jgi:pimeloyl-ACP methyl ester carboxylesterase
MPAIASPLNSTIVRSMKMLSTRARFQVGAVVAPERALADAVRLFLTPPRRPMRERDESFLAGGRGFTAPAAGVRLAAWRFGEQDRPAVILSHGWGGRGTQFHAFVPILVAAGFQAIVFDHAGHGLSEGRQTSLVDFARNLGAVADEVERRGGRIAGIIGHSLGAAAVARFLRTSGRTVKCVLVAPPASLVGYSSWFARKLGLGEPIRQRLQKAVENRYGVRWDELELPQAVASLAAPALVIHDEDDRDVRIAAGLAVARAWPGARFVRTKGLGHNALLRDPGVVRDAVDFLTGQVVFSRPAPTGESSAFAGPAPAF